MVFLFIYTQIIDKSRFKFEEKFNNQSFPFPFPSTAIKSNRIFYKNTFFLSLSLFVKIKQFFCFFFF